MFKEFRIALWLECNFKLSGQLNKNIFVAGLTVTMHEGDDEDGHSIPLTSVVKVLA